MYPCWNVFLELETSFYNRPLGKVGIELSVAKVALVDFRLLLIS